MTSKSMQIIISGMMIVASAVGVLGVVGGVQVDSISFLSAIFYILICLWFF